MKFSTVLKTVGAAALVAGLVPTKVHSDEETGELKVDALLWSAKRDTDGQISLNLLPKLHEHSCCCHDYDDDELEDLFDDDVMVEYTAGDCGCHEHSCCCEETPAEEPCCCADEAPAQEPCCCCHEETPAAEAPAQEPKNDKE